MDQLRRYFSITAMSLIAVLIGVSLVVLGTVYALPSRATSAPLATNTIVVLGGGGSSWPQRLQNGVDLAARTDARYLWVSDPYGNDAVKSSKGPARRCSDAPELLRASGALNTEVICFSPEPATTRGEALAVAALLAEDPDAHNVTVVTFTPHVLRTRYIFNQCGPQGTTVVAHNAGLNPFQWARETVYQTAGFIKAALQGPCTTPAALPQMTTYPPAGK